MVGGVKVFFGIEIANSSEGELESGEIRSESVEEPRINFWLLIIDFDSVWRDVWVLGGSLKDVVGAGGCESYYKCQWIFILANDRIE